LNPGCLDHSLVNLTITENMRRKTEGDEIDFLTQGNEPHSMIKRRAKIREELQSTEISGENK